MFNKSILAAALLTVGAIAGGTAASAAEIGVRNTWGNTTRSMTNGHSWAVQAGYEQYSEDSAGFALGIIADDFTSTGLSLEPLELNASRGTVFGPGGSIVNNADVIDDDREVNGIYSDPDVEGGDADAAARGGFGRRGGAADAARGGDATLNQYGGRNRIVGDNTVRQVAEAGEVGERDDLNVTGGLAGSPTAVDGALGIIGSGYVRSAQGASVFAAGEYYQFTGSSNQGFSEVSTFSR